jgi:dienelactone hydrolase
MEMKLIVEILMIQTKKIEYYDQNSLLEGLYAFDDALTHKRPLILIAHDWSGRNEFANKKAEKLAELGYVGFAIDMFGKGKIGTTNNEKMALIKPLMENRSALYQRILSAFEFSKTLDVVNVTKIGAIGFCFGGLCVLDLARSGVDVHGVVSFHGLLGAPQNEQTAPIKAKILALHGHEDPMVPLEQLLAFEKEMTLKKVDWQVHVYGNTKHAFSNPLAHDEELGTVYNRLAEKRSWMAMQNFFTEIFSDSR